MKCGMAVESWYSLLPDDNQLLMLDNKSAGGVP